MNFSSTPPSPLSVESFEGGQYSEETKLAENVLLAGPVLRILNDRNKHFRVNLSTSPPSPQSVTSGKSGEVPEE